MYASLALDLFLPGYHRYLLSLCYSAPTVQRYMNEASQFSEFLRHLPETWPGTVGVTHLEAWESSLGKSGRRKTSSIISKMRGLRAFFSYLVEMNLVDKDPFIGYPLPRLPSVLPRDVLTVSEMIRLLNEPDETTPEGQQNRLILEVLYATGIRVSELCNLNVQDVNLPYQVIHVRHGKGGKDRVVPIGRQTTHRILAHLSSRNTGCESQPQGHHPLFFSPPGKRIKPYGIQRMLRHEVAACQFKRAVNVTPHTLRHSCATHMHSRGASIFHIKDILGHADVSTTNIYTRVAPRETQRTHHDKHPRERQARQLLRQGRSLPQASFSNKDPSLQFKSPRTAPDTCTAPTPIVTYGNIPTGNCLADDTRCWIGSYRDHLNRLKRSERTIRTHIARLCYFFKFTSIHGVQSCLDVDRQLILAYRGYISEHLPRRKRSSDASVTNQFLAVVVCFYRFLANREAQPINPALGIRYGRTHAHLPRQVPNGATITRILEQPDLTLPLEIRDRAIMEILYSCGLRKDELINLALDAINFEDSRVSVWAGKGKKDRVVPVGKIASSILSQYITLVRPTLSSPHSPGNLVFLSQRGNKLSKNSLLCIIGKYAARAGFLSPGITPHAFRHAFATHLIQNGANLRHVQEMLGHAKMSCTQTYVHLTIPDLKKVHRKTHPLG